LLTRTHADFPVHAQSLGDLAAHAEELNGRTLLHHDGGGGLEPSVIASCRSGQAVFQATGLAGRQRFLKGGKKSGAFLSEQLLWRYRKSAAQLAPGMTVEIF
jgi:hypothetical protein